MRARQVNSTAHPIPFFLGKTGLTPTVTLNKDGSGGFNGANGAVSEIGSGWYALAGNAADRNTLGELLVHATASGVDPFDGAWIITASDPFSIPGTGARTVRIFVNDGAVFLQNATVRLTNNLQSFVGMTDSLSGASFNIDDGSYVVAITKAGYAFAGAGLVISGDTTQTYSMQSAVVTTPTAPNLCVCMIYTELPLERDLFFATLQTPPHASSGYAVNAERRPFDIVSDHLELQLVQAERYVISSPKYGFDSSVLTVPVAASCNVMTVLGLT